MSLSKPSLSASPSYYLHPDVASAIKRLRANDSSIVTLDLYHRGLRDVDIAALAKALSFSTHITCLNVSDNQIGDAAATALAESLPGNSSLTVLRLFYNQIGDAGLAALAECLRGNTTLTFLWLYNNEFSNASLAAQDVIKLVLKRNTVLARPRCVLLETITPESDFNAFSAQCLQVSFDDVQRIFTFLNSKRDFAQACLVCKLWRRLANETLSERPLEFFYF